jgi:hypothetical protein
MLDLLVRREAGSIAGIFAAGLWLLVPFTILHERLVIQDQYTAFLAVAACLVLSLAGGVTESARVGFLLAIVGGLLGLAAGNKIYALLDIPWIIGFGFVVWSRRHRPVEPLLVFGSALLGFLIVTGAVPWASFAEINRRVAGHAYHLPNVSLVDVVTHGITLLPASLGFYAGFWGLGVIGLGIGLALRCTHHWRVMLRGALISLLLYAVAFSGTGYARYTIPLTVPFFMVTALGWADSFDRSKHGGLRVLLSILLIAIAGFWIQGVRGAIVNQLENRWSRVSEPRLGRGSLNDYEMYTVSFFSGNGVEEVFRKVSSENAPPLVVVEGEWLAGANALWLKCFEHKSCSPRRMVQFQIDGAFILSEWLRSNTGGAKVFLVGDDHCGNREGLWCRGSIVRAWPGIELAPTIDVPRRDGGSVLRVAEVRGVVGEKISMLGNEHLLPFRDGFLSPRTRIALDPSVFHGARAVRVTGELVEGIAKAEVTAGIVGAVPIRFECGLGSISFEVPLNVSGAGEVKELALDFNQWRVVSAEPAPGFRFWDAKRAVAFKLRGLEPVAPPG